MKSRLVLFSLAILLVELLAVRNPAAGQELLRLQHRYKPEKIKVLKGDFNYEIKTEDSTHFSPIIGITDSSLLVLGRKYSGRDTYVFHPYYGHARDTIVKNKIYVTDTIAIAFHKIIFIRKPWFSYPNPAEPFAWLFAGGVLGIAGIPVAALYMGGKEFSNYLAMEAGIFAISIPMILIFNGRTKYDMKNKWRFFIDKQNPILDE